jgi:hypothetical protein
MFEALTRTRGKRQFQNGNHRRRPGFNPGDAGWFLQKLHHYTSVGTVRRSVRKLSAVPEKAAAVKFQVEDASHFAASEAKRL